MHVLSVLGVFPFRFLRGASIQPTMHSDRRATKIIYQASHMALALSRLGTLAQHPPSLSLAHNGLLHLRRLCHAHTAAHTQALQRT